MNKLILAISFIIYVNSLMGQTKIIEADVTSETNCAVFKNKVFIGYKIYEEQSKKADKKVKKTGMMTYMDLPLEAKNVTIAGDEFSSKLICFEGEQIKWTKTIGKTNNSSPIALAVDLDGTIYSGEKKEEKRAITIYKFDQNGKELWSTTFDSLETIHEIFVDKSQNLTALVSFTHKEKVEKNASNEYKNKFIYHTLKIDKNTGKRISKILNQGPTYFCDLGYSNPTLQSHLINYFFIGDTLVYSRNDTVKMLTVSVPELEDQNIIEVIGDESEYFVLSKKRKTDEFNLLLNRWAENEELEKAIGLSIDSDALILKFLKNELGGISIIYQLNKTISMIKTDQKLELISTKTVFENIDNYLVSEAFIDEDGHINLIGIKQENKSRTISLIKEEK